MKPSTNWRFELKYQVDWRQRAILRQRLDPFLMPAPHTDERSIYPIMSLYFDSPSLRFYDEKLDGEKLRCKVKLRGYGYRWHDVSPCFLEIKHKVDRGIVKFRRQFERFVPLLFEPSLWPPGSDPDSARLAWLAERFRLRPAVQILYQREAWESPFARTLRVAFDSQLTALHPNQRVDRAALDDPAHRLLDDRQFIFEVKCSGGLPAWLLSALHAAQVQQRAISKYVLGIDRLGLHRREIGVYA